MIQITLKEKKDTFALFAITNIMWSVKAVMNLFIEMTCITLWMAVAYVRVAMKTVMSVTDVIMLTLKMTFIM